MKKVFATFMFLFSISFAFSQDLILTSQGDSINCKITKIDKDYVYFTFKYEDEIRNTLLPISSIKEHQVNFFEKAEVPVGNVTGLKNYKRTRIALNGGYSYLVAKINENVPSDFKDYFKKLKSGYHLGADFNFFISESWGLGVKGVYFHTSNSIDDIYVIDLQGNTRYGEMSDNINTYFIGPSFLNRMISANRKGALIMNFSLGYLGYVNNNVIVDRYKLTGSTVGMVMDIGYDFTISENLSWGLQASWLVGTLTKMTVDDGTSVQTIEFEKDQYESLSRLDLSVGLRFLF